MSAKNQHGAYILARYSTDRQNPDSIEVQVQKVLSLVFGAGLTHPGYISRYGHIRHEG